MKLFVAIFLLSMSTGSLSFEEFPHEYSLEKLHQDFPDGVVISQYRKCRDDVRKNFKPEKFRNNIVLDKYSGQIHSVFFDCLLEVRRSHPEELAKLFSMQKEFEEAHFNRVSNQLEYSLYEKVSSGFRFQDCATEMRKKYPQFYFYKSEAFYNERWGGNICKKYQRFISEK